MALYRLEARMIGRGGGRNAGAAAAYRSAGARCFGRSAAAYRSGGRLVSSVHGQRRQFDYSAKRGVSHTEIIAPAGAPSWACFRQSLWQRVEETERRRDAQLARELLLTLPREVPHDVVVAMVRRWVRRELVDQGMVADVCVHVYGSALDPKHPAQAQRINEVLEPDWPIWSLPRGRRLPMRIPDGPHAWRLNDGRLLVYQPHAHVMLTTRRLTNDGFGPKERAWNSKAQLYRWRQSWEREYNRVLERQGRLERVSAKAKWKLEADRLRASGCENLRKQMVNEWVPVEVHLRGGDHAALNGRPHRKQGEFDEMTAWDWNRRVRAQRRRERMLEENRDRRTARAIARAVELLEAGVAFYRTDQGGLGYEDPQGLVTKEDRKLWSGLHETVIRALHANAGRKEAAEDDRLSKSLARVQELQAQGVRFHRTKTGALGYDDPYGVMTPECYRSFAGQHEAILAVLEAKAATQRAASAEVDAYKRKLATSRQRLDELEQVNARLREYATLLDAEVESLVQDLDPNQILPERPVKHPLVARLRKALQKRDRRQWSQIEREKKAAKLLHQAFTAVVSVVCNSGSSELGKRVVRYYKRIKKKLNAINEGKDISVETGSILGSQDFDDKAARRGERTRPPPSKSRSPHPGQFSARPSPLSPQRQRGRDRGFDLEL